MKVLVVDDVGYSRHFHTRLVQKFGHDAVSAEGGAQAVKLLESDPTFNVVLTDLIMRDVDGLALFRQAQQILHKGVEGYQTPAFLLMTALRPGANAQQQRDVDKLRIAKDLGFVDVLYKPIEPDHLKKMLDAIEYTRGRSTIDVSAAAARIENEITKVLTSGDPDAIGRFYEEAKPVWERLEQTMLAPA